MNKLFVSFGAGLLLLPVVAFAQAGANAAAQAGNFVRTFNSVILYPTIGLLSAVALLVFLFGCFQYIAQSGNDQARAQGVKHITWGIVGLVIMLSAFAIIEIVLASLGLDDELNDARDGLPAVSTPVGNAGTGTPPPVGSAGSGTPPPIGNAGQGPR